jgi:rhodanese-related sulfurtransferase
LQFLRIDHDLILPLETADARDLGDALGGDELIAHQPILNAAQLGKRALRADATLVCMLPGAIAYTWLGFAGRSVASGDMSALRYGLLGLGVLAMIALVPRLFRRFRAKEPAWIETAELQRRLAAGAALVIVDVRQPEEFTGPPGHLPGAVNVPLAELANRTPDLAARKQLIVVVCKTDRRSARAATELLAAGLRDVAVLHGGTDGWHQQGLTLE